MRVRAALPSVLVVLTIVGCTTPAGEPVQGTAFDRALGQIPAPDATSLIEFSDAARLSTLSDGSLSEGPWALVRATGTGSLGGYRTDLIDTLEIDLFESELLISAGTPPAAIVVATGVSNADAVHDAARGAGWDGADVLSRQLDPSEPLTISIGQIRTDADRVVFGGMAADLDWSGSALDDEATSSLSACLGDVVAAAIWGDVAVGVLPGEDEKPVSVICAAGEDPASAAKRIRTVLEEERIPTRYETYAELFDEWTVQGYGDGHVRAELVNATDQDAPLIFAMLHGRELPGVDLD